MIILLEIWILSICVIDYLGTDAKPFLNQFHSSSIYIQCIIAPEKSEAALYNRLQNIKKTLPDSLIWWWIWFTNITSTIYNLIQARIWG